MIGRTYDDYDDLHGNAPSDDDLENLVWPAARAQSGRADDW